MIQGLLQVRFPKGFRGSSWRVKVPSLHFVHHVRKDISHATLTLIELSMVILGYELYQF